MKCASSLHLQDVCADCLLTERVVGRSTFKEEEYLSNDSERRRYNVAIIVFQRQLEEHVLVMRLFLVFNFPIGVAAKSTAIETVTFD